MDIKSLGFGADEQYLYIKVEFYGSIPKKKQTISGNTVDDMGAALGIDTDKNASTGWAQANGGYEALIGFNEVFSENRSQRYMFYNYLGPEHWTDETEGFGDLVDLDLNHGGEGESYMITRLSLEMLGISKGDSINVFMWAEAESNQFHHFAFDEFSSSSTITIP